MEWGAYLNEFVGAGGMDRPDTGKPPLAMIQMSWMSPVADPGLYINYYLKTGGVFNAGSYSNPKMDELLDAAMATVDPEARSSAYSEAQILAAQEAPWIFMFHARNVVATKSNLGGLTLNPNMNVLKLHTVTFS
jgi:peptide/nickel transport system substrate-binding protein